MPAAGLHSKLERRPGSTLSVPGFVQPSERKDVSLVPCIGPLLRAWRQSIFLPHRPGGAHHASFRTSQPDPLPLRLFWTTDGRWQ